MGSGQRNASSDHSRVRVQRPPAGNESWSPRPAVFPDQAGIQAHEVCDQGDVYSGAARRLLGGPRLSLVRRGLVGVFRLDGDFGDTSDIADGDLPGPATHRTILDILLVGSATRIEPDLHTLPAVGAAPLGVEVGGAVTQGEFLIQVVLSVAHSPLPPAALRPAE